MERTPHIVRAADRDPITTFAGGDIYSILASGAETDDGYFLVHTIVPPGGGPPPHIHTREEEAFFILRGELTFLLGSSEVSASAGTFVNVPKGTKHRFRNATDRDAEMLFWFSPAGMEGLFAELLAHPEQIEEIGSKYGVQFFLDE